MSRKDLKDITGLRFGSRVAVEYAGDKKWKTLCDCGREFTVAGADLRRRSYVCNHIVEDRFFSKVDKTESCWLWKGCLHPEGYGTFRNGKAVLAHVFSWQLVNGAVPNRLELDHLCRIRQCVNPAHLEPVTHAENVRRGKLGEVTAARFANRRKS